MGWLDSSTPNSQLRPIVKTPTLNKWLIKTIKQGFYYLSKRFCVEN